MEDGKWKPPHHLPHIISRIKLELTNIRLEGVQKISQVDAIAEGMLFLGGMADNWDEAPWASPTDPNQKPYKYPSAAFGLLWNSINAKRKPTKYDREHGATDMITPSYEWANNPWVWPLTFKVAK